MTTTTDHTGLIDDFDVTAAVASEQVVWIPGELEFLASTFVTPDAPPDRLVTSARCVVTHDDSVLVVTDRDGSRHIVPGGRREPGETLSETAIREVREETGLTVAGLRQVGLVRYRHLTPRSPDYPYPYPWFIQVVYAAEASSRAQMVVDDEWAAEATFLPIATARRLIPAGQCCLLDAAIARRE